MPIVLGRRMSTAEALMLAQIGVSPNPVVDACKALTWTCSDCGKRVKTDDLGDCEGTPTCLTCWERYGLENEHYDHGHEVYVKNCPCCEN